MAKSVLFDAIGGPEVLRLEETPVAEPGAGEVRVRIEAVGLNRAEVLFRSGTYIEEPRKFPTGLGSEAAGVIDAVGPDVDRLFVGQPVSVIPGFSQNDYPMYATHALAPVSAVLPRPDDVDAVAGAAVWMPYLTAYGALIDVGDVDAGDVVVINAASSSLGLAAIHTANRVGATAVAVTRTKAKRSGLVDEGAAEVIVSDDEDIAARVLELTNGQGARFVMDAVAGPGVKDLARAVAADGTLFLWGALSGEPTPYPGFDLGMPALNIRTFTVHEVTRDAARLARAAAFVYSGLRDGMFRPIVDRVFDLEDIVAAHQHLESNTQFGKIVATVAH